MILDDYGNAIGSYETFSEAAESLKSIVGADETAADDCVIIEYDKKGHAINACKYEDLLWIMLINERSIKLKWFVQYVRELDLFQAFGLVL